MFVRRGLGKVGVDLAYLKFVIKIKKLITNFIRKIPYSMIPPNGYHRTLTNGIQGNSETELI